jgi:hypothetical protein
MNTIQYSKNLSQTNKHNNNFKKCVRWNLVPFKRKYEVKDWEGRV